MRLKDLESTLNGVAGFETPVVELEQYPTSAHLAAHVAHTMHAVYDDLAGKRVCDLGTGTGMLSIAAALMGAAHVTAFDIDATALEQASANAVDIGVDTIDFCQVDVLSKFFGLHDGKLFDVVIMNPPFGTKRRGVDMAFLQRAVEICGDAVYSMHKTSTRDYILKRAGSWGATGEVLAELKFDIGRMYKFHRADFVDVAVDLWRFNVSAVRSDVVFSPIEVPEADTVESRRGKDGTGRSGVRGRGRGRSRSRVRGQSSTRKYRR